MTRGRGSSGARNWSRSTSTPTRARRGSPCRCSSTRLFSLAGDAAPALWLAVSRAGWIAVAAARRRACGAPPLRADARQPHRGRLGAEAGAAGAGARRPARRGRRGRPRRPLHELGTAVRRRAERAPAVRARPRRDPSRALATVRARVRPRRRGGAPAAGGLAVPRRLRVALWRTAIARRAARSLVAGGPAIPVLWLIPDLVGSGSPFTGATRAREGTGSPPLEAIEALGRSLDLVLAALWVGAAYAVYNARQAGERAIPVLGYGALAWIAIVARARRRRLRRDPALRRAGRRDRLRPRRSRDRPHARRARRHARCGPPPPARDRRGRRAPGRVFSPGGHPGGTDSGGPRGCERVRPRRRRPRGAVSEVGPERIGACGR